MTSPTPTDLESSLKSPAGWRHGAALAAVVLLHLALAILFHWDRSFMGDEWGSFAALSRSYSQLLTHFGEWTTMNFYLAGLKFIHDRFGGENWLLIAPGLACSSTLVLLAAMLARQLGAGRGGAVLAAVFVATNPYLVHYAVTIRSYILLATFSTAMAVALFSWKTRGRWIDGVLCGVFAGLGLLSHLNAVYSIAGAALLAVVWSGQRWRAGETAVWNSGWRLALPILLLVGLAAAAHLPMLQGILAFRDQWSTDRFIWPTYLPAVAARYFGAWPLWLVAGSLFLAGVVWAFRARSGARWLLVLIAAPLAGLVLARVSHAPGAYARFLVAALPLMLVLMALPLTVRATRGGRAVMIIAVTALMTCNAFHYARLRTTARSVPFHQIASAVAALKADRIVMLGASVHRFGMTQVGVPLEEDLVSALKVLPEKGSLVVIDGFGITIGSAGTQLGSQRVAEFTGSPESIGQQLADRMLERLDDQPNQPMQVELARELLPVLLWLGRDNEANAIRPIAAMQPVDARMR